VRPLFPCASRGLRATTLAMITRIDHIAISAQDFPAALSQYSGLLGEPACAESRATGRRAALFALCNTRILLLEAAADQAPVVCALGLAATDADSCVAQLHAQGVSVSSLTDHPSLLGATRLWELPRQSTRGLTLHIIDRPDSALPAATSFSGEQPEALDHVVIRSSAMDQAVALYGGTLGLRLALDRELAGTRMLFFRSGGVTVEVIADSKASAVDAFYGVAYRVRDLQAAHVRLTAAGFALTDIRPGRKHGTHVFSTRASHGSVPMLFIRDATRLSLALQPLDAGRLGFRSATAKEVGPICRYGGTYWSVPLRREQLASGRCKHVLREGFHCLQRARPRRGPERQCGMPGHCHVVSETCGRRVDEREDSLAVLSSGPRFSV
jgi:catechol 2,3-dioxygenase-like lactoylglutathione lyase family enzyme